MFDYMYMHEKQQQQPFSALMGMQKKKKQSMGSANFKKGNSFLDIITNKGHKSPCFWKIMPGLYTALTHWLNTK